MACAFSSRRIDSSCQRWENISSIHVALEVVRRRNTKSLAQRYAKRRCDKLEGRVVQIAERLLNAVQRFNRCMAHVNVTTYRAIHDPSQLVDRWQRGLCRINWHDS